MKIQEILSNLLKQSGENPNSLSLKTGVSQSTLQRAISSETKEPRRSTLEPIAKFYKIPVESFYKGKPIILTEQTTEISSGVYANTSEADSVLIPMYDTGGSMGNGFVLKDQPGVILNIEVSSKWLAQNIGRYTSAKNLCLVTGFGDSMKPMYNPGDPVMVDIGIKQVDHDGVFFFRIEDEGFIKRLQRIPGEGIIAMSENKAYKEWTIKPGMDFEVLGKVLKVWEGKDF